MRKIQREGEAEGEREREGGRERGSERAQKVVERGPIFANRVQKDFQITHLRLQQSCVGRRQSVSRFLLTLVRHR